MAFINRLSRLFRADLHAVLDQIEEPELLLTHSIREMEEELERQEQHGKQLAGELEAQTTRRDEVGAALARLDEELDVCFQSSKDDLARVLIRRKLQAERLLRQFDTRLEGLGKSRDEHRSRMEQNVTALEGMRQKAELFTAASGNTTRTASDEDRFMSAGLSVDDHDVEVAFLREKARREAS